MSSRCRAAALRFLKIRPRSIDELRAKLAGKGFVPQEIDEAVLYLESIDLLNDRAFTASWIRYRLARPFGFRRIIVELKQKGIEDALIAQAVEQARDEYMEGDVVLALARRRAEHITGVAPEKKKKRIFDYLLRRGFATEEVIKAMKDL